MILDLLEYIMFRFFGHIIIALSLLIASFIIRNKLSQLLLLLKTQSTNQKVMASSNTDIETKDLPVLNLEPKKKKQLNADEFEETFGYPLTETPLEVQAPPKPPAQQTRNEEPSLIQRVKKAARGDKK